MMKKSILAVFALAVSSAAYAGADCTAHPPSEQIPEDKFQAQLQEQGYKIKKFKRAGNCYEIYGWNKEGKKVEIYFDTKTGEPVKTEVKD